MGTCKYFHSISSWSLQVLNALPTDWRGLLLIGVGSIFKVLDGYIPTKILLLLTCHLLGKDADLEPDHPHENTAVETMWNMVCNFTAPWILNGQTRASFFRRQAFPGQALPMSTFQLAEPREFHMVLWFAMRYYRVVVPFESDPRETSGVECLREEATIPELKDKPHVFNRNSLIRIREIRDCIVLKYTPHGPATSFSIIVLTDNCGSPEAMTVEESTEMGAAIDYCAVLRPLQIFCCFIREQLKNGIEQWIDVLSRIEEEIELKVWHDLL